MCGGTGSKIYASTKKLLPTLTTWKPSSTTLRDDGPAGIGTFSHHFLRCYSTRYCLSRAELCSTAILARRLFFRSFDPAVQSSANSPSAKDYLPSLYSSRQQYFRRLLHLSMALPNALSPEAIFAPPSSCPAQLPEKLRVGTTGVQYGVAASTTFFAKPIPPLLRCTNSSAVGRRAVMI